MQQHLDQSEQHSKSRDADEMINIFYFLEILAKRNRFIIHTMLASFLVSIVISLLLPKIYSSKAMVLPPQQDSGLMGLMMGQVGGAAASLAGDLLGKGSPADMCVSMLNSDAISDAIIDRFKLMQVYDQKYRLDTYKVLDKHVDISAGKKDGIISITVEDKDPKRAADMANAYVEELSKLSVKLNITGAVQNKTFLEDRLVKAKADLTRAEDGLKNFQSTNKIISVQDQAAATITGIAQLKGQLAVQEIQLAALQQQFTDQSQEVKTVKSAIANLRSQINKLEGQGSGGAIPGVGSVPALGEQYIRLMREFKIQETLVELLTKQYEFAKLNEAKDVSAFQIIQVARVADKKVKPKRSLIVLASTITAGLGAVLYVLVREVAERMPEEDRARLSNIQRMLKFTT